MKITATEFRKKLFPLLERAIRGETVEILYKGATVKLVPSAPCSKLARAKRQHALRVDADSIVASDAGLMAELEAGWGKDWSKM
jgi:antitoxin (DNA-binding transcriptional repressor) of toxin-antitoxin stability system